MKNEYASSFHAAKTHLTQSLKYEKLSRSAGGHETNTHATGGLLPLQWHKADSLKKLRKQEVVTD